MPLCVAQVTTRMKVPTPVISVPLVLLTWMATLAVRVSHARVARTRGEARYRVPTVLRVESMPTPILLRRVCRVWPESLAWLGALCV